MSRADMSTYDNLSPEMRRLADEYGLNHVLNNGGGRYGANAEEFAARFAEERRQRQEYTLGRRPQEPEEYRRREAALAALASAPHVLDLAPPEPQRRLHPMKRKKLQRLFARAFR